MTASEESRQLHGAHGARSMRRAGTTCAMRLAVVAIAFAMASAGGAAPGPSIASPAGAEPAPSIDDYQHTTWNERDGVPPIVAVMAQTTDGWLWFGGPSGLYRFDGIRFERIAIDGDDITRSPRVTMLLALASGGLAIGTQEDGVIFLKDGRFDRDRSGTTRKAGYVLDMVQDADGDVWTAGAGGLLHFDGRTWQKAGSDRGYAGGGATTAAVDSAGTLWVAAANGVFHLDRGRQDFEAEATADPTTEFRTLPQSQDGAVWLHEENGTMRRLSGVMSKPRGLTANQARSLTEIFDHSGNLWLQDAPTKGNPYRPLINYRSLGQFVNNVLEDRQGNIWIATASSTVHRLRRSSIVTFLAPTSATSGLQASFAVTNSGRVWIALSSAFLRQAAEGLWMVDAGLHRIQSDEIRSASSIAWSPGGTLWAGGRDGLWRRDHDRFERAVALPPEANGKLVRGIAPDCAGGLWVSVLGLGLFRHDGQRWQVNGGLDGLPIDSPAPVLTCDRAGRLWLGYADGRAARVESDRVVMFDAATGLRAGAVTAIHAGPTRTLVAGERGLAWLRGDRFLSLDVGDPVAVERATGIAETGRGDVWLNNWHGVAHLAADDMERFVSVPGAPLPVERFDSSDGYPAPGFSSIVSPPSIAVADDGRVLFASNVGIASLDPAQLDRNIGDPAPVVIESVTAGGIRQATTNLSSFPARTRDLEVDYTALDYSHPERLRFRYRLEGLQEDWVDAGKRRQAFYANLGPGSYRFVVNASDDEGTWSSRNASFDFVIPPTFLQSRIFIALCIVTVLALSGLAYRIRLRTMVLRERQLVASTMRERERIARELHDTLLQGTQGLIVAVQAAVNRAALDDPVRALLQPSIHRANRIMAEGRDRIQELRSAGDASEDLPRSLTLLGNELAAGVDVRFEAIVEGGARDLVSDIASEILSIAREALINAFQHANAHSIELQIVYGTEALVLRIRDDGRGIDPAALEGGARPNHWGLPGMRERAAGIAATLDIWSRAGAGTEIELKVPAATAYVGP